MSEELKARLRVEFLPAILHGDEEHRQWLADAVAAFCDGSAIPEPRGNGAKDARIAELEAENARLRDALLGVALAAGELIVATDSQDDLRQVRLTAMEAVKSARETLKGKP